MNRKTTNAYFDDKNFCETEPLYQYDYGQILAFPTISLPETFEVLFSNGVAHKAKRAIGSDRSVQIPDEYLLTAKNVMAWIFLHDGENDGETVYTIRIPVKPRSKVVDEEFTPAEQDVITQLVATINTMSTQINQLVTDVEELSNRIPALGGWKTTNG